MTDIMALHVRYVVKKLMDNEFEDEIVDRVLGGAENDIEKIFEESPLTTRKREQLRKNIQKLKESKEVVGKIIESVSFLRMTDIMALHVPYAIKKLMDNEFEDEIVDRVFGGAENDIEKMFEES
ncbi:hypothetical protein KSP40_PGU014913 [Platanthera guangdongensis]|uniref:GED domain-containing protein n=1 Tax=Platanthera guangdongensis TaxID=2320717 RepID=A0ABR2N5L0_9ASPA